MDTTTSMSDLVEEVVPLRGRDLRLMRPRDTEALLDEEAFDRDEFLPYWAELWPSSLALARMIAGRSLRGARTLELGCGLGLPSIAAALAGGRVLATDWSPEAVAMTAANAERNGARARDAGVLVGRARPAAGAGTVGPRARLRRALRAPQRGCAARSAPAPGARGVARRPGPRAASARFLEAARSDWTVTTRRAPELANGAVHRLRRLRPA